MSDNKNNEKVVPEFKDVNKSRKKKRNNENAVIEQVPEYFKEKEDRQQSEVEDNQEFDKEVIDEIEEIEIIQSNLGESKASKRLLEMILACIAVIGLLLFYGCHVYQPSNKNSNVELEPTPTATAEVNPIVSEQPEETVVPVIEQNDANVEETEDEKSEEDTSKETAVPSATPVVYSEGQGEQGSAGRIYNADGSSYAINYNGKETVKGKSVYVSSSNMIIIPDADYSYSYGSTFTLVDEYGYAYDYQCSQVYDVAKNKDGIYTLNDGTIIDNANYGNIAVISNSKVAYFDIIG